MKERCATLEILADRREGLDWVAAHAKCVRVRFRFLVE